MPSSGSRRTARFAGSGLGDSFHPAAQEADETAVATAVGTALAADREAPSAVLLENVPADAHWWRELARAGGWPSPPVTARVQVLPSARLAGQSWEEYLAARSRNLRSQVGRRRRGLEREHEVRVRWCTVDCDAEREIALLFRLHDARWEVRSGESALTSPRARAFHADFAAAIQQQGWLRLAFLELDEEPVAAWYGWRIGDRFAYCQAGFDPAWAERSVGFVLFSETIRRAADEGAAEYDMLLGDEPFKLRFADLERPACTVLFAPRFSRARLLGVVATRLRTGSKRLPEPIRTKAKRLMRGLLERLPTSRER
jgi:CelD/BcsL family acetyltransferase involved in cellulose biosynthesis